MAVHNSTSNSRTSLGTSSCRTKLVTGTGWTGSGAGEGVEVGSWDGEGDEGRGGHIGDIQGREERHNFPTLPTPFPSGGSSASH